MNVTYHQNRPRPSVWLVNTSGHSIGYLGPNLSLRAKVSPLSQFSPGNGERGSDRLTQYIVSSPRTEIVNRHSCMSSARNSVIPSGVPLLRISVSSFTVDQPTCSVLRISAMPKLRRLGPSFVDRRMTY